MFSDQRSHIGSLKAATVGEFTPQTLAGTTNQGLSLLPNTPRSQLLNIYNHITAWIFYWDLSMFIYESTVSPTTPPSPVSSSPAFLFVDTLNLVSNLQRHLWPDVSLLHQQKILFQTLQFMPVLFHGLYISEFLLTLAQISPWLCLFSLVTPRWVICHIPLIPHLILYLHFLQPI